MFLLEKKFFYIKFCYINIILKLICVLNKNKKIKIK